MSVELVRYDAARRALADAYRVDEVKDIRDKAQAMAAYARQAKDTELVEWATEIKVRAERRAGELLREMAENGQRATRGNQPQAKPSTLEDLGVTEKQSHRWQKLAAVPADQFEQAVAAAKQVAGEVTTAALLRLNRSDSRAASTTARPDESKDKDLWTWLSGYVEGLVATLKELKKRGAKVEKMLTHAQALTTDLRALKGARKGHTRG